MSQHDMNLANAVGAVFRADLNDALAAIVTNSSGATEPTTMFAYQWWVDTSTTPKKLKLRNGANNAWIEIGTVESANFGLAPLAGAVFTGAIGTKIITETKTAPTISTGTLTLDLAASSVFDVALNAAITTLTLSNPPASGTPIGFTLIFTADGTARAVTWPASVKWPGGTAPTLTSTNGKKDFFSFYTQDGGTTYQAFVAGQNL